MNLGTRLPPRQSKNSVFLDLKFVGCSMIFLRHPLPIILLALTFFIQPIEVHASEHSSPEKTIVVNIKGQISKNVLEKVRRSVLQVTGDPIPAGLIVLLDSPGGDGEAAIRIGHLLRASNAHIFVTGECASACIFVLAGGVVRVAPAYSVGIHRGRITMSDADAKIIKEVDPSESPAAQVKLLQYEAQASRFLAEMGMSPELFTLMQSHQFKGVYRLSSAELAKFGLTGFAKAYWEGRAALFTNIKDAYQMDELQLKKRTMRVASRCSGFDRQAIEFVRCYKETLRDPFLN